MINNTVKLELNNGVIAKVDKGNLRVGHLELEETLTDLFKFKRNYSKGELIKLSQISDSVYDIKFLGAIKSTREVCFQLC